MTKQFGRLHRRWALAAAFGILTAAPLSALAQDEEAEVTADVDDGGGGGDIGEQVIFSFEGAFDLMFTDFVEEDGVVRFPDGQEVGFGNIEAADSIRTNSNVVLGTLKTGTKGLGYNRLNTYINLNIGFDVDGAAQPVSETVDVNGVDVDLFIPIDDDAIEDTTEHRYAFTPQGEFGLFLHSAYAELDGLSDDVSGLSLRAGRQSHWGAIGNTTFDGVTLGFELPVESRKDTRFNLAVRGGQRSQIYGFSQEDPGLFAGLTMAVDMPEVASGLLLRADYALFTREVQLTERDAERRVDANGDAQISEEFTLNQFALNAYLGVTDDILVSLGTDIVDADQAPNISNARAGLVWAFTPNAGMELDTNFKLQAGLPYDLSTGRGIKVQDARTGLVRNTTHEVYRLNFPDRQPAADIDLRVPIGIELSRANAIELVPKAGVYLVLGDDEELSPYDANSVDFGLGTAFRSKISNQASLQVGLDYDGIIYDRTDANLISDPRSAPEDQSHRLTLSAQYDRGRGLRGYFQKSKRTLTVGAGAYLHVNALQFRPYINTIIEDLLDDDAAFDADDFNDLADEAVFETEVMFGFAANVKWWPMANPKSEGNFAVGLDFEFAQDSEIFLSHMAAFTAIQASAEVLF